MSGAAPTVLLRRAVTGDEAALSLVGAASFLEAFAGVLDGADIVAHCREQHAEAVYRDWLESAQAAVWLAEAQPGGAPVGYLVLDRAKLPVAAPRADDLEIKRIYLLHAVRGTGTGAALMRAALQHARECGAGRVLLGVYSHNESALAFYAGFGFQRIGERRFRVGRRDYDDYVLACELATG